MTVRPLVGAGPASASPPIASLRLPAHLFADLRQRARQAAPRECCGLLFGRRRGLEATAAALVATANHHPRPEQGFTVPPAEILAALRRRRGELVGFYHSHPQTDALPSRADRRDAWTGYSYLIVPVGEMAEARSWWVPRPGGPFVEEVLRIEAADVLEATP